MGIYDYFISRFDYILSRFNQLTLFGGYGIIAYFVLLIITGIVIWFVKRLI